MPTVGLYQFDEEIGSGAFGTVYKGRHSQTNDIVAGKKLQIEKAYYDEKYEDEARILIELPPHENVVKIIGFEKREIELGGIDCVELWLISEYLPYSLKGYANTYDLSVDDKLELMIQCCRGLLHLHNHDIIHRDLKPDNVMVSRDEDGKPTVKIIDFGESRIVDRPDGRTEVMKSFVGTQVFMAPELLQKEGNMCKPEYRTSVDVFALGITFLSLLPSKKRHLYESL